MQTAIVQWAELIGLSLLLTHLVVTFVRLDYRRLDRRYNEALLIDRERQAARSRNRY